MNEAEFCFKYKSSVFKDFSISKGVDVKELKCFSKSAHQFENKNGYQLMVS